jgi:lipopolysaccharide export system protein LptA
MKYPVIMLALCCATPAFAADAAKNVLGKHDTSAPIVVNADKQDFDLNAKTVTYTGNVIVTQGDIKMHSNTMKVTSASGKADKIYADGKVLLNSPTAGSASGDNAVYDVVPHTVTLSGHVVLTKVGRATMRGAQLTVNLDTGLATLGGAAKGVPDSTGGRVQGVFTPSATGGN